MDIYKLTQNFYNSYKGEKTVIGKSFLGRDIYAFHVGSKRGVQGVCQYAMHAREYITAYLAFEQIKYGLSGGGAWFIPLLNPDGALLCQNGINSVEGEYLRKNLIRVNGSHDFSLWKANANCVDLNVNFAAKWGTGKSNVKYPKSSDYIGKAPFSEPESKALRDFTLKIKPNYTLSYHALGEEIYWYFDQGFLNGLKDKRLACVISRATSYPLRYTKGSAGGYKDWCISRLKIPSFTIEVGKGEHPIKDDILSDIINKNLTTVRAITEEY